MEAVTPTQRFSKISRMRVHRNTETTTQMRRSISERVTQGWTQPAVAEVLGISVRTVSNG